MSWICASVKPSFVKNESSDAAINADGLYRLTQRFFPTIAEGGNLHHEIMLKLLMSGHFFVNRVGTTYTVSQAAIWGESRAFPGYLTQLVDHQISLIC
jgi:hypothetical protein